MSHGKKPKRSQGPIIEALEPRILFSADAFGAALDASAINDPLVDALDQARQEYDAVLAESKLANAQQRALEHASQSDAQDVLPPADEQNEATRELVLVDTDTPDYQQLVDDLTGNADSSRQFQVILLDNNADGIAQITAQLAHYTELDAVHIISHGEDGAIDLGATQLNQQSLLANSDAIGQWSNAFSVNGDLLIYGCNLAATSDGELLVNRLAAITGADVAASDDLTGSATQDGDWDLEYTSGSITTEIAFSAELQQSWQGSLSIYTVTNSDNSGAGSLRQAIIDSNTSLGVIDTIEFNLATSDAGYVDPDAIPANGDEYWELMPSSDLNAIIDTVIIDATTQAGFSGAPVIELDGTNSFFLNDGLTFAAGSDGSVIHGLSFTSWVNGVLVNSNNNTFVGNYFGINAEGAAEKNFTDGLRINSNDNTIGGLTAADRNIISNSDSDGIHISGGNNNSVLGNYIGTDVSGTGDFGNANAGINIDGGASDNKIGGSAAGAGNTIGFNGTGIAIEGGATTDNTVQGNFIGTDSDGALDLGNSGAGILISGGASDNLVGGTAANAGNLVFHNNTNGIEVRDASTLGNTLLGNRLYDNTNAGIDLGGDGVTVNDVDDADSGNSNNRQNFPVITQTDITGSTATVSGSLDTDSATTQYRLEFFSNALGEQDPTNGEGRSYLGSTLVTTDGSGDAVFSNVVLNNVYLNTGDFITATATKVVDAGQIGINDLLAYGDTSEFALNIATVSINNAPVNSVPTTQVVDEDKSLVLSTENSNVISVGDLDSDALEVTLTVTNGTVSLSTTIGPEQLVNSTTLDQQIEPVILIAPDDSYVVTWTSKGQDDIDGKKGVYFQRFDAAGSPIGGEVTVNQTTLDDQDSPAMAMDAAGNFVITWVSNSEDDVDGSDGVYARLFNADGSPAGNQFLVTQVTSDHQADPSASMDDAGNFVVVWESKGQDNVDGNYGIYARLFNAAGAPTSNEILVNQVTLDEQRAPSVAMDADGDFVVAWQSKGEDNVDGKSGIYARQFDATGTAQTNAFLVNQNTPEDQKTPVVATDDDGNFAIAWESKDQDFADGKKGIVARMYDNTATALADEFIVNSSVAGDQLTPSIGMDANGAFIVAWESKNQDHPDGKMGIFAQHFDANGIAQGNEFSVNQTTPLDQKASSIGLNSAGHAIAVWQSKAQDNVDGKEGIYGQHFLAPNALAITTGTGSNDSLVTFSGSYADVNAALNGLLFNPNADFFGTATIQVDSSDGIASDSDAFNITVNPLNDAPSNSLPAAQTTVESTALTFSTGNGNAISIQDDAGALPIQVTLEAAQGAISLSGTSNLAFTTGTGTNDTSMVFTGTVVDINNALQGMTFTPVTGFAGNAYLRIVTNDQGNSGGGVLTDTDTLAIAVTPDATNDAPVNNVPATQNTPVDTNLVFSDSNGNLISVTDDAGSNLVELTLTATNGTLTLSPEIDTETQVNTNAPDDQLNSQIATAADGSYIVVWEGKVQDDPDGKAGIFAQRYNPLGEMEGPEFQVNTFTAGDQKEASVAMNDDGVFVITWQSANQDGAGTGIFGQLYNTSGSAVGSEFEINSTVADNQTDPDVAMDSAGNFVVTWAGKSQDNLDGKAGVFAQRFDATGVAQGDEFQVNTETLQDQLSPSIAMDIDGDFVIVWASKDQDNADGKFGIYGQRYNANGVSQGLEFPVNTETLEDQTAPDVAMDDAGNFVVAWQSKAQDNADGKIGIFAQRFDATGTAIGLEIPVNTTTAGDQLAPSVAMQSTGEFIVSWESKPQDNADGRFGIYTQRFDAAGAAQGLETLVNTTTLDDQILSSVALDDAGNALVSWSSKAQDNADGKNGVYLQRLQNSESVTYFTGTGVDDASIVLRGTVAQINELLDGMVFKPSTSFNGVATLEIDIDDLGSTGTGGPYSDVDTIGIIVGPPNNAPTLGDGSLSAVDEDTTNPAGETVSTIFTGQFSDIDGSSSMSGIAVVGNTANATTEGAWQYSTNGGTNWYAIGNVADDNTALTISSASLVRFVPTTDYNGTPTGLTVRGLDNSYVSGFSDTGGSETRINIDTSTTGGTTAIAAVSASLDTSVTAVNDDPTLDNAIANQAATEDTAFSFTFNANTFGDVDTGDTLTYSATLSGGGALPSWLTFNAGTRTFSGTPLNNDVGTISVEVTADDSNGGTPATDTFDIVVANSNDDPTLDNAIPNQAATEDSAFSFAFNANTFGDVDSGDTLTYSATLSGGGALPSWLTFNAATRTFSGTPLNADVGTISVEVTADDSNGGTPATDTFDIVIANTNDDPTLDGGPTKAVNVAENSTAVTTVTATDIDLPAQTLNYSIIGGADAGLFSIGSSSGDLTFDAAPNYEVPEDSDGDGVYEVIVQVDDGNTGTDTQAISVTVTNTIDSTTFYLKGDSSPPFSGLSTVTPTDTTLNNFDPGRDAVAGLIIAKGGSGANETIDSLHHTFVLSGPVNIANQSVQLIFWSDIKDGMNAGQTADIALGKNATVHAYLIDMATGTTESGGTIIASNSISDSSWGDGFVWEPKTIDFGTVNYSVAAGRHLALKFIVDTVSAEEVLFAYDTTSFDSHLIFGSINNDPTLDNAIPDQAATEDSAFSFSFNANAFGDVDAGDTLTYSAAIVGGGALPSWLTFNEGTRTFTGTPLNADVGTISIEVTANDGSGGTPATDTFDIVIANSNDDPTLDNAIPNQAATEDTSFSFAFNANTFGDVDAGDTLTYSATLAGGGALPSWLTFNAGTRTFSGTPLNADVGTISVEVTADDSNGGTPATDTFDIVIANSNDDPTLDNAIPNQAATEDTSFSFAFNANTFGDVDAGDSLTYTATLAGGGALPSWLTFNAGTRTFSGTPLNADVGTIAVEVTADDSNGGTPATDTFDIVIANSNDDPTLDNAIPNQAATEDTSFSFAFNANTFGDVDSGDTLNYSATLSGGGALPSWLTFNAGTRTFSGTPLNADVGTISVEVTADDGNGGTPATDTFDIVIANTNDDPTVDNPIPDQSTDEDSLYNYTFNANTFGDVDTGDILTYSAQLSGGAALPSWLAFDGNTRTFVGVPLNADVGFIDIEVIADDGTSTISDVFRLTIDNVNDAPTIGGDDTGAVTEDVDPDSNTLLEVNDALTIADPDAGESNFVAGTINGTYGDLVIDTAGNWSYSADNTQAAIQQLDVSEFITDTLTVTTADGTTHDIVITINGAEDAPTVDNAIADQSATEDTAFNFTFNTNTFGDVDTSDTLTYTAQLNGGGALPSWLTFNAATRTFSGTPLNADVGTISIDVIADDGSTTIADTFTLTVNNTDDAPVIGGVDTGAVTEDIDPDSDTLLEVNNALTIADPDAGESSFVAATINGTYGDLVIDTAGNWSYSADNTQAAIQQLDVTEFITDTLTVTTADGTTHDIVITIDGAEDASVQGGINTGIVAEDGALVTSDTLTITDVDTNDNPISYSDQASITGNSGYGNFEMSGNTWTYTLANGSTAVQSLDAGQTVSDSFTFTASDSSTQTVTVTINGAEDAPTASNNTIRIDQNSSHTLSAGDFGFSDIDGDSMNSVRITALETAGDLKLAGSDVNLNDIISRADIDAGLLTWSPLGIESGDNYATFGFSVNDGAVDSGNYSITYDVTTLFSPNPDPDPEDPPEEPAVENTPPENTTPPGDPQPEAETADPIQEPGDQLVPTLQEDNALAAGNIDDSEFVQPLSAEAIEEITRDNHNDKQDDSRESIALKQFDLANLQLTDYSIEALQIFQQISFLDNDNFVEALDNLGQELERASSQDKAEYSLGAETRLGLAVSLSAGFVSWALRAGSLMASFFSIMPLWKQLDPLPIIGSTQEPETVSVNLLDDQDDTGTAADASNEDHDYVEEIFKTSKKDAP